MMPPRFLSATLLLLAVITAHADAPRVLPAGKLPDDARLGPLKTLDDYFPFTPPATRAEWEPRAEKLRRQMLVSLGLWPLPARTPLNTVVHGRIDREDYSVEKVYFESVPGFFVTGNLYRPKGKTGKLPGVLCPHGHWNNGRFLDSGEDATKREIVNGAERFLEGGRSVLQARCVQLARMGCVVFHYDMIGYADSRQLSFELAHGFKTQRPDMNATENWGLFSPPAETHLQSVMGLQTWDSMRALDFLLGLPDVDADRIACTGASGGGTQTFILCALDPRVKVAFPAVMVSTAMQGGCTCENACLLRVGVGNVDFAALFVPKPLGMTCADDWTKEMSTKGFPELKRHYTLFGAPDNVSLKRLEHFGHNYNYVSRAAMYSWLNRHLKLGLKEPIVEEDYRRLTQAEMSVWDAEHPSPPSGPEFERTLLRAMHDEAQKQLQAEQTTSEKFRKTYGGAWDVILDGGLAEAGEVEWKQVEKADRGSWIEMTGLLRNRTYHEELPAVFCYPKQWNGQTVAWFSGEGKAALFTADGSLKPEVKKLVDAGATVVGVDLLYQGEFLADGKPLTRAPLGPNPRESAAYTFGYNHPLFTHRVHDVLSVIKLVKTHERPSKRLDVIGVDGAGPWVAAARAQAGAAIDHAAIDTGGFRFGKVLDLRDPNFLPGGAKYGDLPGLLGLSAPGELWLAGETTETTKLTRQCYQAAQVANKLAIHSATGNLPEAAVAWLLQAQ